MSFILTGKEIDFILNKKQSFEVKETAQESDLIRLRKLSENLGIKESYIIGHHPIKGFPGFIWGGYLR